MGSGLVEQDLCTAQCQTKCNWITSVVSAMLEMFICVESNSQGCCWAVGTWLTSKLQERKERYWVDACRVRLDKKLRQWLNAYMPHVDQGLELLPAGLSRLPESFQDKFENGGYFLFKPKWLLNFQRAAWKTASPGCSKVGPHVTEEGLSDKLPAHPRGGFGISQPGLCPLFMSGVVKRCWFSPWLFSARGVNVRMWHGHSKRQALRWLVQVQFVALGSRWSQTGLNNADGICATNKMEGRIKAFVTRFSEFQRWFCWSRGPWASREVQNTVLWGKKQGIAGINDHFC